MYYFILSLLFLCCLPVSAETIYTPYYETKTNTQNAVLEKEEIKKLFLLEEKPQKTEKYYPLTKHIKGYAPLLEEFIYSPYSKEQKICFHLEQKEITWAQKTWFQMLKPISSVSLKSDHDLFIEHIAIWNQEKTALLFERKGSVFLKQGRILTLPLAQKMQLEELVIVLRPFLEQDREQIKLTISDNEKMSFQQILITQKGYSTIETSLSREIQHFKWQSKIYITSTVPEWYYIRILKQEKRCRTREKLYRFQKVPQQVLSEEMRDGYILKKEVFITKHFRREKIVLKDVFISKTPYLLVDDFVLETSFPLKELKFNYPSFQKEGIYPITISYKDFSIHRYFTFQKNVE